MGIAAPTTCDDIIALTASAFGEDVEKCFEAGVTLHVVKPVKKAVLLAAIRELTADAPGSSDISAVCDPRPLSIA
jgi:CheY-like chemotaxis protein